MTIPLIGAGTDGRYDHTRRWNGMPSWAISRPWATREEQLTTQALQAALTSAPDIQDWVRPPLPQVVLFPPRFGYRTRVLGIADIVDVDRKYQEPLNFSGVEAGYEGTARNAWNQNGGW